MPCCARLGPYTSPAIKCSAMIHVPVYSSEANTDGTYRRQYVVRKVHSEQARIIVKSFEMYASGFGLGSDR